MEYILKRAFFNWAGIPELYKKEVLVGPEIIDDDGDRIRGIHHPDRKFFTTLSKCVILLEK